MIKARERTLILFFLVVDLLLLNVSLSIVAHLHYTDFWDGYLFFYLLNLCWFITYLLFINEKLFQRGTTYSRGKALVIKFAIYLSIASFLIVVFNLDELSRTMFLGSTILFIMFKIIISYFYSYLIAQRKYGQYYSTIVIIGAGKTAEDVMYYYRRHQDLGKIVGCLTDKTDYKGPLNIVGDISDFGKMAGNNLCTDIIITLQLTKDKKIKELIDIAEKSGIRPRVVPNYYAMFKRAYEMESLGNIPLVNIRAVPVERYANRFWKRAFDIVFSIGVLVFASPVICLIAIAIKVESKGPIFYTPIRCGRRGKLFKLYKFRSMFTNDNELSGTKSTVKNDPRVTKVGKFIRKNSLDEFPQFINVLLNQMSVVGPRPHRANLNKTFQEKVSNYMVRHYTKPGVTGWAQVNGWRGPTETKIQYVGRALHDLWYIENWTFGLDIYIIFLTIFGKKVKKNVF